MTAGRQRRISWREQPCDLRLHTGCRERSGNAHRSEPARSTKLSLPRVTFCVCRLVDEMMIDTIRWLRLDSRFICRAG